MQYKRNFYQIKDNQDIFNKIEIERGTIGYYSLPYNDVSDIEEFAKTITKKFIVVIGIGGSSLGAKSIYQFLAHKRNFDKEIIFLDTIDPLEINYSLKKVEIDNAYFVVISKSGNTLESISLFKHICNKVKIKNDNCCVISDASTALNKFADCHKLKFFEIPKNVGGRFSVFSNAGLVPLALIGVNIKELLNGCKRVDESFFSKDYYYDHIINKARFLVENKSRFNINVIFSYSRIFEGFNKWFIQLWAESLGKLNINGTRQGLTPIALIGPEDQHSFLQLIIDGPRDKTVTFFKVDDLDNKTAIPICDNFSEFNLDFINNKTFNDVLNHQADSTYEAIIKEKDIPCDLITISSVDEYNIAKLMYRYQLLVSCIGSFLQINPYNQPAVEFGKNFLKESLGNE